MILTTNFNIFVDDEIWTTYKPKIYQPVRYFQYFYIGKPPYTNPFDNYLGNNRQEVYRFNILCPTKLSK